ESVNMDYQNIQWQSGDIPCEPSAELYSVLDEMTDINPSFQDCGIIICTETVLSAAVSVRKSNNNIWMKIKSSADDFIFFFIENIIRYKKTDTHQAYNVVRLAKLLEVSQPTLSRVYAMYNWGGIEKGQKYLSFINNLDGRLRDMLFAGKVSIQAAVQFGEFFAGEATDKLLAALQPLTFSEINQSLQYIVEITKQKGEMTSALTDIARQLSGKNAKEIIETLYRMRYPNRSVMEKRFEDYLVRTKLKNRVTAPFLLEKQQYSLSLSFKDSADLIKQMDAILQKISSIDPSKDMFILDNLFGDADNPQTDKQDNK
ncbi:MAG: hypothetical protein J6Y01_02555, partial [Spirochaetales bacterium]|nr:hypothetical protein [Spirochaetales bacterium]